MNLTRQQVAEFIKKAPQGSDPAVLIKGLAAKGHILEGYNDKVKAAPEAQTLPQKAQQAAADIEMPSTALKKIPFVGEALGNTVGRVFDIPVTAMQGGLMGLGKTLEGAENLGKGVTEGDALKATTGVIQGVGGIGQSLVGAGLSPLAAAPEIMKPIGAGIEAGKQGVSNILGGLVKNITGQDLTPEQQKFVDESGNTLMNLILAKVGEKAVNKQAGMDPTAIEKGMTAVAAPVKKAVSATGKAVKSGAESTLKFGTAQASGLSPETLATAYEGGKAGGAAIKAAQSAGVPNLREGLLSKTVSALEKRQQDLRGLGAEYEPIRAMPLGTRPSASLLQSTLSKFGIKVGKDGNLDFTDTTIGNAADRAAISEAYGIASKGKYNTVGDLLNVKGQIDDQINWKTTMTGKGEAPIKALRNTIDELGKENKSLASLEAKYGVEKEIVSDVFSKLYSRGEIKDNAMSTLANLTNKGNESKLAAIEKIVPGISKEVKVLKALEDVELATGQKVGAYASRALLGGGAAFVAGGPLAAGAMAILTNPSFVFNAVKNAGKLVGWTQKEISAITGKLQSGTKLTPAESKKMGEVLQKSNVPQSLKGVTDKSVPLGKKPEGTVGVQEKTFNSAGKATTSPLHQEALKYKTPEDFVKAQGEPLYHGTPAKFDKFDTSRSEGGATWFSGSKDEILSGDAGAVQGKGQSLNIMERQIKPDIKLATPKMEESLMTDQLIAQGYRGVKYPKGEYGDATWTKLWFPNEDTIKPSKLTSIWNEAQKGTSKKPPLNPTKSIQKLTDTAKQHKNVDSFVKATRGTVVNDWTPEQIDFALRQIYYKANNIPIGKRTESMLGAFKLATGGIGAALVIADQASKRKK